MHVRNTPSALYSTKAEQSLQKVRVSVSVANLQTAKHGTIQPPGTRVDRLVGIISNNQQLPRKFRAGSQMSEFPSVPVQI